MNELLKLLVTNTETTTALIPLYSEKFKPVLYTLGNEMLKVYKDIANNTEYSDTVAKARMNQYNSYIRVGFTEEQAMSLLLTDIRKTAELLENSLKNNKKINTKTK